MLIGGKPHWHTEPLRMAYGASIVWGRSRSGNQAARNCRQITWQRDNSARRYMKLCAVWTTANRWQAALAHRAPTNGLGASSRSGNHAACRYMKLCAVWTNADRWQAAQADKRLETAHFWHMCKKKTDCALSDVDASVESRCSRRSHLTRRSWPTRSQSCWSRARREFHRSA